MESDEGVLLPWFHKHLMVPCNFTGTGHCCGRVEATAAGYYCIGCKFFIHKKCSECPEYIQHPSHSLHPLCLRRRPKIYYCDLCGKNGMICYCCEKCDFDMHLYCAKYPPPEVIETSEMHHHELTLLKKRDLKFDCDAKCGKIGYGFPYKCHECELYFHVDCVWYPLEANNMLEYTAMNVGERVSLPWIHEHSMVPWKDPRKGDCCGRSEATDGYFCTSCDFFIHKKCDNKAPESIQHPSHSHHPLWLQMTSKNDCDLCGKTILDMSYSCKICDFDIDLYCVMNPPPEVIEKFKMHHQKLNLIKERTKFLCDAKKCGRIAENEFAYKSHERDLAFHVDCVWVPSEVDMPLEVNNSYHSLHLLKLQMGRLNYFSDGKCRLCGREIDYRLFYHCSSCNFSLDMRCVLHPPPQSILDLKAHEHQLTLLLRLDSFKCNACSLEGYGSRYVCFQCGFTIHQECLDLPCLININRHDHRVSRTSVFGVVNSVCGVCRKNVEWTYGGYSCQRCLDYVVHSKCATRGDVWNEKELEGIPEEIEDIEPYVVIDKNTIQHFSHTKHYLRLNGNGLLWEENKRCNACSHPIGLRSFYGCIDCDFILHKNCAEAPRKIRHVLHNERLTLVTNEVDCFICDACKRVSYGFLYKHGKMKLDIRCSLISKPFVHPSHPQHPLYYIPRNKDEICNGCKKEETYVLICIEDGCEFVLGFGCATLPQVVKHRVDDDPLSLWFGEDGAKRKYWCDICEKECDPKLWFYTCKDHRSSLHTRCVLGDFVGLKPIVVMDIYNPWEVLLNTSLTRPHCKECKTRCIYPIIIKDLTVDAYFCSSKCMSEYIYN